MKHESKKYQGKKHTGSDRSSPYPVSRMASAFELVDLARQISEADKMLNSRVSAKLKVIADQIKALQHEARSILAEANRDQELNHARCNFQRKPGNVYHLYKKVDGTTYFSMLSPEDWQEMPPHEFIGSYRLENDMSWRPLDEDHNDDDARLLVGHLLSARNTDEE
jgi:hypothetical protein